MEKTSPLSVLTSFLTITALVGLSLSQDPAGVEHLGQCIKMAEPLVQNPDLIFPLTQQNISSVCKMWDAFVDCVYEYTTTFLTESQSKEFNKAIESSIESIHQLCVGDPVYQRMYIAYAPCMKRVTIDAGFCGNHYRYLADLVQTSATDDVQLCCAHQKFRNCVLDTTPIQCDSRGISLGTGRSASQFMRDMLDRALGFLLQKCRESTFSPGDCPIGNPVFPEGNNLDQLSSNGLPSTRSPWNGRRTEGSPQSPDSITPNSIIPSLNLGGNNFLGGAESQQFRGSAATPRMAPILGTLAIVLPFVFKF